MTWTRTDDLSLPVQTGVIRVANCNLHNQAVGEGISAVVQDVNIRQFIEQQQQHGEAPRLQPAAPGPGPGPGPGSGPPPLLRRSVWLEAGSVNLNLITADVALAADHSAKCEVQRHFLELHDAQTKRFVSPVSACVDDSSLSSLENPPLPSGSGSCGLRTRPCGTSAAGTAAAASEAAGSSEAPTWAWTSSGWRI